MNDRDVQVARAIWESLSPLLGDYSEVPFEHVLARPRYQHLRETLERAVEAVRRAA